MNSKMKTLAVLFFIGCAALLGAIGWMRPVRSYITQSAEAPEVIVAHNPQSPLEIVSTKLDALTSEKPEIEFTVVNKSSQPVIAYAIRIETSHNNSKAGANLIFYAQSTDQMLQPGRTSDGTIGNDLTYSDPIKKINLFVDYVELADGSTWGPDRSKTSETLSGERAGAKELAAEVRALLKTKDPAALVSLLEQEDTGPVAPSSATGPWANGFRLGAGTMKDRLRRAYKKDGTPALELELNKPFDPRER